MMNMKITWHLAPPLFFKPWIALLCSNLFPLNSARELVLSDEAEKTPCAEVIDDGKGYISGILPTYLRETKPNGGLTICVTRVGWAWTRFGSRKNSKRRKIPENRAESPASSARIVSPLFVHPILGTVQLASLFPWLYTLLYRNF